jgi:hypothetical protein
MRVCYNIISNIDILQDGLLLMGEKARLSLFCWLWLDGVVFCGVLHLLSSLLFYSHGRKLQLFR